MVPRPPPLPRYYYSFHRRKQHFPHAHHSVKATIWATHHLLQPPHEPKHMKGRRKMNDYPLVKSPRQIVKIILSMHSQLDSVSNTHFFFNEKYLISLQNKIEGFSFPHYPRATCDVWTLGSANTMTPLSVFNQAEIHDVYKEV